MVGRLLHPLRGRDANLFTKASPFQAHRSPTIPVYSPDYSQGPSSNGAISTAPTAMDARHPQVGGNGFPSLAWTLPAEMQGKVDSWVVVVEDPDAPLPSPVVHGIYYGLAAAKTTLDRRDLDLLGGGPQDAKNNIDKDVGLYYGRNLYKTVWVEPKPIMGHGPHRYFFQVVGVKDVRWDEEGSGVKRKAGGSLTKEELIKLIQGKVVGWGLWMGVSERRWEW